MSLPALEKRARRVLVFGGRDYTDAVRVEQVLRASLEEGDIVVHGGAPGADSLAGDIAGRVLGHEVEVHPANWALYRKAAGPMRNQDMIDSGIDYAIGFPGGKGTADMLSRVMRAGIAYEVEAPAKPGTLPLGEPRVYAPGHGVHDLPVISWFRETPKSAHH